MASITYNLPQEKFAGEWVGDRLDREHVLSGGAMLDASQFGYTDAVTVTVATGGAAQGATSVPVTALPGALPSGTLLDFTGSGKFAKLTAAAAASATSITVEALPQALVAGDTATYNSRTTKFVPSGTLVGRTYTERDAGTAFGPAAVDGSGNTTDDEVFLILYDVNNALENPEIDLYRRDSIIYERYLPASSRAAGPLALIRRVYTPKMGRA